MDPTNNKYKNGKIYKIVDIGYNKCYYGSTIQSLSMRMGGHRRDYTRWKNDNIGHTTVYNIFDEFDINNCKIELVELFPCSSKSELEAREGYHIKDNDCVNKNLMGRSKREYRNANKERISEYNQQYYEMNKDHIKQQIKQYYDTNKDRIKEQSKEKDKRYYDANKDRIKEHKKQYYEANKDRIKEQQKTYRDTKKHRS